MHSLALSDMKRAAEHAIESVDIIQKWLPVQGDQEKTIASKMTMDRWFRKLATSIIDFIRFNPRKGAFYVECCGDEWLELSLGMHDLCAHYGLENIEIEQVFSNCRDGQIIPAIEKNKLSAIRQAANDIVRFQSNAEQTNVNQGNPLGINDVVELEKMVGELTIKRSELVWLCQSAELFEEIKSRDLSDLKSAMDLSATISKGFAWFASIGRACKAEMKTCMMVTSKLDSGISVTDTLADRLLAVVEIDGLVSDIEQRAWRIQIDAETKAESSSDLKKLSTSNLSMGDQPLTENDVGLLETMLNMNLSCDSIASREDILKAAKWTSEGKRAFERLKQYGYVEAKKGVGYYLTKSGRIRANQLGART